MLNPKDGAAVAAPPVMQEPKLFCNRASSFTDKLRALHLCYSYQLLVTTMMVELHNKITADMAASPHHYACTPPLNPSSHPHEQLVLQLLALRNRGMVHRANGERTLQPWAAAADFTIEKLMGLKFFFALPSFNLEDDKLVIYFSQCCSCNYFF